MVFAYDHFYAANYFGQRCVVVLSLFEFDKHKVVLAFSVRMHEFAVVIKGHEV